MILKGMMHGSQDFLSGGDMERFRKNVKEGELGGGRREEIRVVLERVPLISRELRGKCPECLDCFWCFWMCKQFPDECINGLLLEGV